MELTEELLKQGMALVKPRVTWLLGKHASECEDVLQEACLKAFLHAKDFQETSKFTTWFYVIARNEALMLLRKKKHRPTEPLPEYDFVSNRLDPEEILLAKGRNEMLVDSVLQLSPGQRRAMLSWAVGKKLDTVSPNTLKARRHWARKELREILGAAS